MGKDEREQAPAFTILVVNDGVKARTTYTNWCGSPVDTKPAKPKESEESK